MKDGHQKKQKPRTKNNTLESKSPAVKAKSEVLKKTTDERDGHMRNGNGILRARTRVIKKLS